MDNTAEFLCLRDKFIESKFAHLNNRQKEAVFDSSGPLLVIAGAGSGKTTVIIARIAYMVLFGSAHGSSVVKVPVTDAMLADLRMLTDGKANVSVSPALEDAVRVDPVPSENILAITFTNKAAGEMKERLSAIFKKMMGGDEANKVYASTFHSACARFLREDSDRVGLPNTFAIYDTADCRQLMRTIYKDNGISEKDLPQKQVLDTISSWKDEMISPAMARIKFSKWNALEATSVSLYEEYQRRLRDASAVDFDDLIYYMVEILRDNPDVLEKYHKRFSRVLVDEYQDTSHAQYELVKLLTPPGDNVCVVGDEDQSIYSFRGAVVENILNFPKQYPNAKVVRLEQNYRSTETILCAANSVIANNSTRLGKTLWTQNVTGEKIEYTLYQNDKDEASGIVRQIRLNTLNGYELKDQCILYRNNYLSRPLEAALVSMNVPYRIIGGPRFYERKEIKDVLSYLTVIQNPNDDTRLRRIINVPARKIGPSTVDKISAIALREGKSMMEIINTAASYTELKRNLAALNDFAKLMSELTAQTNGAALDELCRNVIAATKYLEFLDKTDEESSDKAMNVSQLVTAMRDYQEREGEYASLSGFLEEVSLINDIDALKDADDMVTLMTIHTSKGLEFPIVFGVGMEQEIFPGNKSAADISLCEEERRLFYVEITRAKSKLYLSGVRERFVYDHSTYPQPSSFLFEIDRSTIRPAKGSDIFSQPQDGTSSFWSNQTLF